MIISRQNILSEKTQELFRIMQHFGFEMTLQKTKNNPIREHTETENTD